jgi:hypothetical protein
MGKKERTYKKYAERGLTIEDIALYTGESVGAIQAVIDSGSAMAASSSESATKQASAKAEITENLSAMELAKKQASISILRAYESGLSEIDAAKRAFEAFAQYAERGLTADDVARFTGATTQEIGRILEQGAPSPAKTTATGFVSSIKEGMNLFTDTYKALLSGDLYKPLAVLAGTSGMGYEVPAYSTGGIHSGGLALVGERGPELVQMGPARVINAQDTKAIMAADSGMVAEMRSMLAEMRSMAYYTKRTSDLLLRVTRDGESLVTTVTA